MARNGSGTFSLLAPVAVANTVSSSTSVNATMDDVATALTDSINVDGTKAFEANQSLGGFKTTSVGAGSARTDGLNIGQVQDGKLNWVDGGGTADAITATYSPAITALVDGQLCFVRATAANTTTTPTFSPNGLTARTIVKTGGVALAVGDIVGDGHELILRYLLASTRWELLNPATVLTGYAALASANTFTANQTITSTDADAGAGPGLSLYRNSATPAASDAVGYIAFEGEDSAGNQTSYAYVVGTIIDPTDGSEDSSVRIQTLVAGSLANQLHIQSGVYTQGATSGAMGAGTVNATEYYKNGVALNNGGMILLGTIDTSSGASASITSLTLTSYKALYVVFVAVSSSSDATFLIGNSTSDDVVITSTTGAAAASMTATAMIELSTGIGTSISQSSGAGSTTTLLFDTALSTSSTAVSVAPSAGNLDAGSVLVYGMR